MSRGWAGLSLVDDKPDCRAIAEVNHQALFQRVAAIVHPHRVQHLGLGTALAPGTPSTDSLTVFSSRPLIGAFSLTCPRALQKSPPVFHEAWREVFPRCFFIGTWQRSSPLLHQRDTIVGADDFRRGASLARSSTTIEQLSCSTFTAVLEAE